MKVLVACEESQAVCKEFRKLGHEAFSCDIIPCSGGHPEWHIQQDLMEVMDGDWDMMIAFPPCTYLTVTANRWYKPEYADRYPTRTQDRIDAVEFLRNQFYVLMGYESSPRLMPTLQIRPLHP